MELYRCDRCGVIRKHAAHISMNSIPVDFDFDMFSKKEDRVRAAFPDGVDLCESCFDKLQEFLKEDA